MKERSNRMPTIQRAVKCYINGAPEISPNGLFIGVASGKIFYLVSPASMEVLVGVQTANSFSCKLTDDHVFLKHYEDEDSSMISLQETKLISAYRGTRSSEQCEEIGLQFVICNEF